jgi:hypothetical protein
MLAGLSCPDTHVAVDKADFLREFANQSVQCAHSNLLQIYEAGRFKA